MGLITVIEAKMPTKNWARKCFLEAHRFGAAESYVDPSLALPPTGVDINYRMLLSV